MVDGIKFDAFFLLNIPSLAGQRKQLLNAMEGVFSASKDLVASCANAAIKASEHNAYRDGATLLCRSVLRVAGVINEIELQLHIDESLRGSEALFMAGDSICSALQAVQKLLNQSAHTGSAMIWPLEDSVEFQAVARDLLDATSKLEQLTTYLPEDINADIYHVLHQLRQLKFTEKEFRESEEKEFEDVQIKARDFRSSIAHNNETGGDDDETVDDN